MLKIFFILSLLLSSCGHYLNQKVDEGNILHQQSLNSKCFENIQSIVMLGGGMSSENTLSNFSLARVEGLERFLLKYRSNKKSNLIFSGGPVYSPRGKAESVLMKQVFLANTKFKKDELSIYEESKSLSTIENAKYVDDLFDSNKIEKKIILLTGVLHLKRALDLFLKAGFEVCPGVVAGKDDLKKYYEN